METQTMYSDEELKKSIEDFKLSNAAKQKNDKGFQLYLKRCFVSARDASDPLRKEAKELMNHYRAQTVIDYFGEAHDTEDTKKLLKSTLFHQNENARLAIMMERRYRPFINPVFKPEIEHLKKLYDAKVLEPWMQQEIDRLDGSVESWLNAVLDVLMDDWIEMHSRINEKIQIALRWEMNSAYCFFKPRITGEGTSTKDVVVNVVPITNGAIDPTGTCRADRKYVLSWKYVHVRDVEDEFDLKRGDILPDNTLTQAQWDAANVTDETRHKYELATVVEMYFRDNTVKNGKKAYPRGRYVVFCPFGQDTASGVKVLYQAEAKYSLWTLVDYIENPVTENESKPVGRDLLSNDKAASFFMQISAINAELMAQFFLGYDAAQEGSEDIEKMKLGLPGKAVPMPGGTKLGINLIQPVNIVDGTLSIFKMLKGESADIAGIHEAATGKRPGDVESGTAIRALDQSVVRGLGPSITQFYHTLSDVFTLVGEMFLEVVGPGHEVRIGRGYRTVHKLPFALSAFIAGVTVNIGADTTLRRDPQAVVELLTSLNPQTPLFDIVLEYLPVDDKERIRAIIGKEKQYEQMIQTLQQQLQQLGVQAEKSQKIIEKLQAENAQMQVVVKAGLFKAQLEQEKTVQGHVVSLNREQMRQKSVQERAKLQSDTQLKVAEMQSLTALATQQEKVSPPAESR